MAHATSPCRDCGGSGLCIYCDGCGRIVCAHCDNGSIGTYEADEPCSRCYSNGTAACPDCYGSGLCDTCNGNGIEEVT